MTNPAMPRGHSAAQAGSGWDGGRPGGRRWRCGKAAAGDDARDSGGPQHDRRRGRQQQVRRARKQDGRAERREVAQRAGIARVFGVPGMIGVGRRIGDGAGGGVRSGMAIMCCAGRRVRHLGHRMVPMMPMGLVLCGGGHRVDGPLGLGPPHPRQARRDARARHQQPVRADHPAMWHDPLQHRRQGSEQQEHIGVPGGTAAYHRGPIGDPSDPRKKKSMPSCIEIPDGRGLWRARPVLDTQQPPRGSGRSSGSNRPGRFESAPQDRSRPREDTPRRGKDQDRRRDQRLRLRRSCSRETAGLNAQLRPEMVPEEDSKNPYWTLLNQALT